MLTGAESDNPYTSPAEPPQSAEDWVAAQPEFKVWRLGLFLFCLGAVITQPTFTSYYFHWMFDHGAYPWYADSITIGITMNLVVWLFWAPPLTIVIWYAFWRLKAPPRPLAWQSDKKWKSGLVTLFCLACVYLMVESIPHAVHWRNWVDLVYIFWWIVIWLLLRAALLSPKMSPPVS